jgi:hypothetical protein
MWYLRLGTTEPTGPHSTEQIQAAIAAGTVSSQSTVMAAEDGVWRPVLSVPAFAAARPKDAGVSPLRQIVGSVVLSGIFILAGWVAYEDLTKPKPPVPASSPEVIERNLRADEREAREKIRAVWADYDKTPPDKFRLAVALAKAKTLAEGAPTRARQEILERVDVAARDRMAPLIRPESRTDGDESRTLVPSDDAAKCLLWASMWRNETAKELKDMGFTRIACPTRGESWPL